MAATVLDELYRPAPQGADGPVTSGSRQRKAERLLNQIGAFVGGPGTVHQADLLSTTTDPATGDRYAVVVVDLATRLVDAEPVTNKDSKTVLAALQRIYARNTAKGGEYKDALGQSPSVRLETDGADFKADVKRHVEAAGAYVREGRPGRHQQQALAENVNGLIGTVIAKRQAAQELLTDEPSREWVADLPAIVAAINARWQSPAAKAARARAKERNKEVTGGLPYCRDRTIGGVNECILLPKGTRVRVVIEKDRPRDVRGEKLAGTRRAGDPHFTTEVHTVTGIVLTPGMTPRYRVSDFRGTLFKRQELREVNEAAAYPLAADVMRGNPEKFVPLKLHDKRKKPDAPDRGLLQYLVEWRGYPEPAAFTWELRKGLVESTEGKRLVAAFQ